MFRGLYTATNSMRTNAKKLDSVANNIANSQTTGFKKDVLLVESFPEKLMVKLHGVEPNIRPARQNITIDPPVDRQNGGTVRIAVTKGYLSMEDRQGIGYYKSALVKRDEQGYLRTVLRDSDRVEHTKFGAYLLDRNGNRVQVGEGAIAISADGTLQVGGAAASNIVTAVSPKVIGTMNGGSVVDRTMINFTQGGLEHTENPLNLAIEGEGFFKVTDVRDNTVKYTRQGAFALSEKGILIDHSGNPVLSVSGKAITVPTDVGHLSITRKGELFVEENNEKTYIDQIQLVNIANKEDMQKHGEAYLVPVPGKTLQETAFEANVLQGYLESSNVETVYEMVEMIETLRRFEADQKVIRSYDDIMNKAANEIGKLS